MEVISSNPCNLCPRECRVNRANNEKGYCRTSDTILIARAALHMWEEPCISGKHGSGTVFFSGCNLRCIYCQNFEIAAGLRGKETSLSRLKDIFLELQEQRAANINLVTPDHFLPAILKALQGAREEGLHIPIVYNGSGYEKEEIIESLSESIDIFLTDFKYMDSDLSEKYSSASDYPTVAKKALAKMFQIVGEPVFDQSGMLQKGVIVRHLLLPGHKRNAKAVLQYIYETYGNQVIFSLMNQYTPLNKNISLLEERGFYNLCRKVTKREYEEVIDFALSLGIENAYMQEGATAQESFIPEFDGQGV